MQHTHHNHNTVLETSSGQPFRPAHVIAVQWSSKSKTALRITLDTGEVVTDHWPTPEDAGAFMEQVKYAMRGIDYAPQVSPVLLPEWATYENAVAAAQAVVDAGGSRIGAVQAFGNTMLGLGEPASVLTDEGVPEGNTPL